jgi:hypothetical protein
MLQIVGYVSVCGSGGDYLVRTIDFDWVHHGDIHLTLSTNPTLRVETKGPLLPLQEHPIAEERIVLLGRNPSATGWRGALVMLYK